MSCGTELYRETLHVQPLASSWCISSGQCHSAPGTNNCPERAQRSNRVTLTCGAFLRAQQHCCAQLLKVTMVRTGALDLLDKDHYDCPKPAAGKSQCLSLSTTVWL